VARRTETVVAVATMIDLIATKFRSRKFITSKPSANTVFETASEKSYRLASRDNLYV
jgi:hypothetical protein